MEKAKVGALCWNCGKVFKKGEYWHYYYHGDQDDRICSNCAKKIKHDDTAYAGINVFETSSWGESKNTIQRIEAKLKKQAGF